MKKRSIIIVSLLLIVSILTVLIYFSQKEIVVRNVVGNEKNTFQKIEAYDEGIEITNDQNVVFDKNIRFSVTISNFNTEKEYEIECKVNNEVLEKSNIETDKKEIIYENLNLMEGKNDLEILYYANKKKIGKNNFTIYYSKPYTKQFLDELSNIGFSTHFGYMYSQDNEKDVVLLKNMGCFNVRDDIRFNVLGRENGLDWVNKLKENHINLYAIVMPPPEKGFGDDKILNNDEELAIYRNIMESVVKKINNKVYKYEMYNEPNWTIFTKENIKWYARQTEETISLIKPNKKASDVIIGATCASGLADNKISSINFLNYVLENNIYKYNVGVSFHSYDLKHSLDSQHQRLVKDHRDLLNRQGGFLDLYISEYGADTSNYGETEDYQSNLIIRQTVYNNMFNVKNGYIYGFRDMGFDMNNAEHYYGVITHDYKPKKSYYAMKNYYENTNGAEYIGKINRLDGLELHIYNKDGKPKIMMWSDNSENHIQIPYQNLTAKDLYGQEIPNTNGTLTITTSPIYLDNLSTNYFYQAISTTASQKYEEFLTSFEPELTQMPELNQSIITLKTTIESLKDKTDLDENLAKELMAKHYNLGNELISYCRSGKLTVEYVKLSSMLDKLNDIGNSYEDLVTVSAKTRNLSLDQTNQAIQKVEQQIEQNQDLDIIYPTKILEFSQDYYEKANYINNLEEENEIKTGLIVSKNLHAKYLASWAEQFTNLYLDEYIEANPLTLSYSQTNLTNQDVTVTLSAPYDFQVTNNHQAKTYTFTQNGSFTFHYSIRGQAKEMTATVTNIDKTPPTITGVEEGKLYFDEAKPIVQDENLQEVKLIVNDQVFESYETNTTIKVEGIYQLIATDKAGNQTKVSFEIIETPDLNYQIKEDKILNIKNNTTKSIFDQTIRINTSYQIKRQNKVLTNADKIATGDILETSGGQTYALIVAGDIDGDGEVGTIDLVKMRKYLLGAIELNDIEKLAADANVDGKAVGIQDLVRLRILILSKDN